MEDTKDLKSFETKSHAGSSPASGTLMEQDKDFRIIELSHRRKIRLNYLKVTVNEENWHECRNAINDIIDIESELKGLQFGQ